MNKGATTLFIGAIVTMSVLTSQVYAGVPGAVSSLMTAPAPQGDGVNPYQIAGIDDPKQFIDFLSEFQSALRANDVKAVSELLDYPVKINKNGKTYTIYTKEQFIAKYDRIFTTSLTHKILRQSTDEALVNMNGVMLADGAVWVSKLEDRIAVYSINVINNPYEVAGIDDPQEFDDFFAKLQSAVASNDKKAIAAMVSYPLLVNKAGHFTHIASKTAFVKKYNSIITEKVKKKVLAQKLNKLFVNSNGVMIGDGDMWISKIDGKISIYAINL